MFSKIRDRKLLGPKGVLMALMLSFALLGNSCAPVQRIEDHKPLPEGVYLPQRLKDPIEPLNRGIWAFNHGLLQGVISPTARGYRMVVPAPARTSIKNFGYNLGYPGRALNQVLQGRVNDAGDESLRFLTNTTVGVAGLFDVASKWDIPKHRGNFGQTFQTWGWDGKNFIVLPLFGPSDESSALGFGADRLSDPLSHYNDGRAVLYGVTFNKLSENVQNSLRLLESDPDSYDTMRAIWTYAVKNGSPDWSLNGPRHAPSLETLAVATLKLRDVGFLEIMKEAKVEVPTTGKKLPFNYWLQDEPAPLVYVVPGLGAHRLTMQALSVAEGLYDRGYSVVAISGMFHPEFIEFASRSKVPGYSTAERKDAWALMGAIDSWLQRRHGKMLGSRAMVGTSMGGFQAMAMAAEAHTRPKPCEKRCKSCQNCSSIHLERFLAINPPVDLFHSMDQLDAYQEAPSKWPQKFRQQRVNNAVHKAVALISKPEGVDMTNPPFDGIESKYLVGLAFRLTLRNAIFASHRSHKLGKLERSPSNWNRNAVYNEILGMSFRDYVEEIVLPHYAEEGVCASQFRSESMLSSLAPGLANCPAAHVITSSNDFLLSADDIAWLERTFGKRRLTLLDSGGHLGGLANPALHDLIASKLSPLKASK